MLPISKYQSRNANFKLSPLAQYTASNFCASDYEAVTDGGLYETYFGGIRFGSAGVFMHKGRGRFSGHRRIHHIRDDHVDDYLISLPVNGTSELQQMGARLQIHSGNFVISSTAKPLSESIQSLRPDDEFAAYQVIVSGSLLRTLVPAIDAYCHIPIKVESGAGEIMVSLFSLALSEGAALSESQSRSFGDMLIGAIVNTTRDIPELARQITEHSCSPYARIRDKASHFIVCNLSNPALSPTLVAQHCNISERYLYAAFAETSTKPGQFIKETRLDRCRTSLKCSELMGHSVQEIALSWGFKDAAYFSRTYKEQFGKTPKEDRYS
jgi:AraC-like DNA-binding protein